MCYCAPNTFHCVLKSSINPSRLGRRSLCERVVTVAQLLKGPDVKRNSTPLDSRVFQDS